MNPSLLIIVPFVFLAILLFCRTREQVRAVALAATGAQLVLAGWLLLAYLSARAAGDASIVLFEYTAHWFPSFNIEFHTGVDGISVAMILLTAIVLFAAVLVSWKVEHMPKEFFALLLFLGTGAFGFFISLDLFTMFFFFEMAVIPKYLLIGIWGSGRKEYSAMKLVLMLTGGSVLVILGILGLYFNSDPSGQNYTFDLLRLYQVHFDPSTQRILFPLLFVGFGVLSALFPFHTWAPDGHSSAPTAASMFLAGISMKLGGYGCLKVATLLLPDAAKEYSLIILCLALMGILYGAFATAWQKDLKMLNAYSSVSHCGFVLLGLGVLTPTAMKGAVLQMVSHGLMTALFFAAIGMLYERTHTRMKDELGGLLKVMPFIGTVFMIAGLCSLGLPGLSGFAAEITVFVGGFQSPEKIFQIMTLLATLSLVVTAVYILRATGVSLLGPITNNEYEKITDATWNEKLASIVLLIAILGMGIAPWWLADMIGESLK